MTTLKHTINLAVAPIVTVFDDRGEVVQAFMLPICLIIFLPAHLWAAWLKFTHHVSRTTHHVSRFLLTAYILLFGPGWREDLHFMTLAMITLFSPPTGRGWGRAAL